VASYKLKGDAPDNARRRWGYRRLHVLLQREGWTVNSKRVYRIYAEEKLMVRRRKRRRRICAKARVLLAAPVRKNDTWTMDLLQDALASGRKVRTLSIVDAYTREMLAIEADTSLPALRVIRVLDRLPQHRGMPVRIVIDNGTEFTSKALDQWAYANKVTLHFITPGRPMGNGYIESFHGKFREECLNEHWFLTLDDARETIESWRIDYNQLRPHSALGYLTPEEFATGYANVDSQGRFPHSHNLDGGCGLNLQLNSNPSALTCSD
jgi:putative transposase